MLVYQTEYSAQFVLGSSKLVPVNIAFVYIQRRLALAIEITGWQVHKVSLRRLRDLISP